MPAEKVLLSLPKTLALSLKMEAVRLFKKMKAKTNFPLFCKREVLNFLTEKFCQILVEPFCYDAAGNFAAASFSVNFLHYGYSEFP